MNSEIIGLTDWLKTPPGRYLLAWEQSHFDEAVSDIFGYHALQLGLPELEIRGVPAFLGAAASRLLVEVANHLAEGKDDAEHGVLVQLDKQPAIRLEALGPTDEYDTDHYQAIRFCLTDATADTTAPGRSFPAMPFARA